ncbi:acetate kinase [Dongia mobilis]|uniref:Acetate kinase n=2 Tax=Dongia mobilis TaxID=578943 RepID=A0A4R6WYJ4_9PROT|nr:acetate kinase [Dongia mobilis]
MQRHLLAINAGSSSIKFQLFRADGSGPDARLERRLVGQLDGIGSHPRLVIRDGAAAMLVDRGFATGEVASVEAAQEIVADWLSASATPLDAIGHRVVHGGADFTGPVPIDTAILARIAALTPLAPLHQPKNLAPIHSWVRRRPDLPQVASFDTAFHRSHGALADRFAIPEALYAEGVRRYGFHGLSYEFIAGRLREAAPSLASGRVIVAHLGNGCSLCALKDGRSIDSSMSFTALDGVAMGTRPGSLDPGVVLYLMREKGMDAARLERFLYHECGLKGMSGISNDLRVLEKSDDPQARLALDFFVHRIGKELGALTAVLGGLDALVFTAGIGENAADIRARIVAMSAWAGLAIDPAKNAARRMDISAPEAKARTLVLPTDEERMIARHMLAVLGG